MKKILMTLLLVVTLTSCVDNSTQDVSKVTNYPIITINGESEVIITQGDTYTDAGAVSKEGDNEITTNVSMSSGLYWEADGIDTSSPDLYYVNYLAENKDGFNGSAIRNVWVAPNPGDLVNSIEGLYTSSFQRAPDFATSEAYSNAKYVMIKKIGVDKYELSHAIGGYYDLGRGFGSGYAARGAEITANDISANDFTISQAVFPIWGNTVDITDFTVDAGNKTITFTGNGNFGNGTFKVQLKQVNL